MHRALPLVLIALLAGCYRYIPQRPDAISPGSDVRVHLSADGARRLAETYPSVTAIVDGRLERWSNAEVEVLIPIPAAPGGLDRGLQSRIILPQADVVAVELRERDATRTAVLSVSLGTITALTAIAIFGGVFGGGTEPEDPLPEDVLVPHWLKIFP